MLASLGCESRPAMANSWLISLLHHLFDFHLFSGHLSVVVRSCSHIWRFGLWVQTSVAKLSSPRFVSWTSKQQWPIADSSLHFYWLWLERRIDRTEMPLSSSRRSRDTTFLSNAAGELLMRLWRDTVNVGYNDCTCPQEFCPYIQMSLVGSNDNRPTIVTTTRGGCNCWNT